jgi:hypothetical protein
MLAFSWNDPVPAAKPRSEHSTRKGKSKHGAKKSTRKSAAQ